jgi:hypothetical protein
MIGRPHNNARVVHGYSLVDKNVRRLSNKPRNPLYKYEGDDLLPSLVPPGHAHSQLLPEVNRIKTIIRDYQQH